MFKLPTLFLCALCVLFLNTDIISQGQPPVCASLTADNPTYFQDFNTLAAPIATTGTYVPVGFGFAEEGTGADLVYGVSSGSSTAPQTYSFGRASGSTMSDRAFGGILGPAVNPTIGACFTNNTNGLITSLLITYDGEMWRLGEAGRADRLDFQYSLNATSLLSGTWVDRDELDFSTPDVSGSQGPRDGNNAIYRRAGITSIISGLSIPAGSTIYFRFRDFDTPSIAEDGLAIDNFSLTATIAPTSATVSLSGRVLTAEGRGVPFALVSISGDSMRTVRTNPFGHYRFTDLTVGQTYIVSVASKSLAMTNSSRMIKLQDEVSGFNFTADPR